MTPPNSDGGAACARGVLSPNEAASYLGLHVNTLALWRQRGEGPPFVKMGRRVGYRPADLEAWLDACEVQRGSR